MLTRMRVRRDRRVERGNKGVGHSEGRSGKKSGSEVGKESSLRVFMFVRIRSFGSRTSFALRESIVIPARRVVSLQHSQKAIHQLLPLLGF